MPQGPDVQNVHLQDMLISARKAASYVSGQTFEQFWESEVTRDAVAMRLATLGESARHITHETAKKLPGIPFDRIRGMRNRIAHDYSQVNFRIVWDVATEELTPLIQALDKHLESERRKLTAKQKLKGDGPSQGKFSLGP